jgi:hypothetical protein
MINPVVVVSGLSFGIIIIDEFFRGFREYEAWTCYVCN